MKILSIWEAQWAKLPPHKKNAFLREVAALGITGHPPDAVARAIQGDRKLAHIATILNAEGNT